jgi:glucose uptake protein GlcU
MLAVSYDVGVGAVFLIALCVLVTLAATVPVDAFFIYVLGVYHAIAVVFLVRSLRFFAVDQPASSADERGQTLRQAHVIAVTCLFQWLYFMVMWMFSIDRGTVFSATLYPWVVAALFFTEADRRLRARLDAVEQRIAAQATPDKV